ncbi:MAG: tetratricopeptide repeat protein [Deltaproteobacteria bacterium]|nr:MAG: tetratricopeptide repeat protein [Deltaproteobacteria bacterium]
MHARRGRRARVLIAIALVAATVAAYAPLRHNDFVQYDDNIYITENPNLPLGFSREGLSWAFFGGYEANWIPLTWLSLIADYRLHALDPRGYHATNLALHVLGSLLLFAAFARMTRAPWQSGFVAAVFALHPLHVESVAWASERKDALSGFFFMLTLLAYAGYASRPSAVRYAGVCVSLALGLMAKPMLVTVPFVLLLLDAWPLDRLRRRDGDRRLDPLRLRRAVLEKLGLLPLVVASSVATVYAQHAGGAFASMEKVPLGARIANALHSYAAYLWQGIWPRDLAVYYPHPREALPLAEVILCGVLLLLATGAALRLLRRAPYVAVGWFWYLGMLVPVIGLVQVGSAARADRYTYLPFVGLAIALAWGAPAVLRRVPRGRAVAAALGAAAVLAMATVTARQVAIWRSTESLFEHALRVTADNAIAHIALGGERLRADRLEEAQAHFDAALEIWPRSALAQSGLGNIAAQRERWDEATRRFRRALRIDPDLLEAHAGLGYVALQQQRFANAIAHYFDFLRIAPNRPEILANLGHALALDGRPGPAIERLRTAIRLDPQLALAHAYLGQALAQEGRMGPAIASYREALRLDPDLDDVRGALAGALMREGQTDAALAQLEIAVRREPERFEFQLAMGDALQAAGRDAEAAARYREALRRQPDSKPALNNLAWLLATSADAALRDADEAVRLAERAAELSGRQDASVLDTLAAAQAAAGRPAEAERTAAEALERAADDPALAARIREHLRSYREGSAPP